MDVARGEEPLHRPIALIAVDGEHHYYFWVFALSRPVEGTPSREEFLDQYADAIIEQARTVGLFSR